MHYFYAQQHFYADPSFSCENYSMEIIEFNVI